MSMNEPWMICKHCIMAIRSRGEEIFVGSAVELDPGDEALICEFCDEEVDTLYKCF